MFRKWIPAVLAASSACCTAIYYLSVREAALLYAALLLAVGAVFCFCLGFFRQRSALLVPLVTLTAFVYAQRAVFERSAAMSVMLQGFLLGVYAGWAVPERLAARLAGRVRVKPVIPGRGAARAAAVCLFFVGCAGTLGNLPASAAARLGLSPTLMRLIVSLLRLMPCAYIMLFSLQSGWLISLVASFAMLLTALPQAMLGNLSVLLERCAVVLSACLLRVGSGAEDSHRARFLPILLLPAGVLAVYRREVLASLAAAQWTRLAPVGMLMRAGLPASLGLGLVAGMALWTLSLLLRRHWGAGAFAWLALTMLPLVFLPGLRPEFSSMWFIPCFGLSYFACWGTAILFGK